MKRLLKSARSPPSRRRKIVVRQRRYIAVTKKGLEFVRNRYSGTVPLAQEEIKLYGFLMRLISFGGIVRLSSIERWGLMDAVRHTMKEQYASVTASKKDLPKDEIQELIKEIWGDMPEGFCV